MEFNDNNENTQNISGSIFVDAASMEDYGDVPVNYPPAQKENLILKLFESFVEKFIEEPKRRKEQKDFIESGQKMLGEYEDILTFFHDAGCLIVLNDNYIELEYPQLNLKGTITFKDGQPEFDDTTNKIMNHLSNMVINTNKLDDIINKHEDEGFYPVGDLAKETIILNGESAEVLAGEMMNKQGQTKKVYYYQGKEVQPDKK